jgi:hypothetical protein
MAYDYYRSVYSGIVRLYPRPYRERFADQMLQTFNDLCRERTDAGKGLSIFALWMYIDTFIGVIKENNRTAMSSTRILTFVGAALCLLLIPLFAMLFHVSGWDWDATDFIIMAALLAAAGVSAAYVTAPGSTKVRIIGAACLIVLILLYVHLAVGIVDWLPFAGS